MYSHYSLNTPSLGKEKLSKNIVSQKWDRLKLVCTQPYNKVCMFTLYVCISVCIIYDMCWSTMQAWMVKFTSSLLLLHVIHKVIQHMCTVRTLW